MRNFSYIIGWKKVKKQNESPTLTINEFPVSAIYAMAFAFVLGFLVLLIQ